MLVVIYTGAGEVLLLERRQPAGYWQSVTGSLEWEESAPQAAIREVAEETGLDVDGRMIDCGYSNRFEIIPPWRQRYAPDQETNIEHVFRLELAQRAPISIAVEEHRGYQWLPAAEAVRQAGSHTNREAIERFVRQ